MSSKQSQRSSSLAPQPTRSRRVNENGEPEGSQPSQAAHFIPINWILPAQYQPRQYFDKDAIQQLTASVKEHGILQPLLVRPKKDGKYELVAGERRYKAAREAGLTEVPVVVRELTDFEALQVALIENLHRGALNPVEEAEGILQLLALHLECDAPSAASVLYKMKNVLEKQSKSKPATPAASNEQASEAHSLTESESVADASRENVFPNSDSDESRENVFPNPEFEKVKEVFASLGKMTWESFVVTRLRLLNLPSDLLDAVRTERIEYTKAKAIARVEDKEQRQSLLEQAIAQGWSLSQIKEQVALLTQKKSTLTLNPLSSRLDATYKQIKTSMRKKQEIWENPQTQARLEVLLKELEALLGTDS